eukprot:TRINITY_DN55199_c0_g1_i1.p1 TRINITY_DN55199_c0_g1~~TRINITY_DN55199_c0_g1_i1.p1  ORF type:complete len:585 (-),score=144.49 TRINITY_DN55199_c0_g1_i1:105-1859(-)
MERRICFLSAVCCLVTAAAAEEEETAEGGPQSKVAVAIAATLMGSISFQMSLYYFTNFPDADVKKYSWEVISSTISIFCAVLLFQSFQDIITVLVNDRSIWVKLGVGLVHMFFWYAMLQVTLAIIAGVHSSREVDEKRMELDMKCWAVLLAHMTGFAAINFWGEVQHLAAFAWCPLATFLVVPLAFGAQMMLQRLTDATREWVSLQDNNQKDHNEEVWDEHAEESEDDVLGLSLSFLMTQSFRYLISGVFPSSNGEEEGRTLFEHGWVQPIWLSLVAACFAVLCAVAIFKITPMVEESPTSVRRQSSHSTSASGPRIQMTRSRVFWAHLLPSREDVAERFRDAVLVTGSMGYAWCAFFAAKWFLANIRPLQDDQMLLGVVLALFISFASFTLIVFLDWLADKDWTPEKVDCTIKQLIGAIGILVGFAWEQCFDGAVEALASVEPVPAYRHLLKMALALFCVAIIVPAWRLYMLPMVIREGWRFGFVVDHELMADVVKHLKEERDRTDTKQAEKAKKIHNKVVSALEAEFVQRRRDWHRSESLEEVLARRPIRRQLSRKGSRRAKDFGVTQSEPNWIRPLLSSEP